MKGKDKKKLSKAADKCSDKKCSIHGQLSIRGHYFKGVVKKIVGQRIIIELQHLVYLKKYERFAKSSKKLHAYLSKCLIKEINVGDIVKIGECRPISKMIHFVVIEKIK